jgi:hypothetical protein
LNKLIRRLGTFLLCLVALCTTAHAQTGQRTYSITVVAPDVGLGNIGSAIAFHQISWNPIGSVPTCQVKLEQSADDATWSDLIPNQTCTSSGQSTVVYAVVNYVRINVTTKTGTGPVTIHWNGFNVPPSGSTLTGVGAPTNPCVAGSLYTDTSTGNLYSCDNGTWLLVANGGGGSVTLVNTVLPITGGPITTTGTISCPNCVTGTDNDQNANQLLSGGYVEWTSLLHFTVGAATYSIGGVNYSSPLTNITLAAADPTNDRIDTIYVDNTGAVGVLTGTPAVNPLAPTVDPATQLMLSFVYVAATATVPTQITKIDIYHENVEWTTLRSPATNPPWNLASTNNPYDGTVDIEATTAATGNYVSMTVPAAGTVDLGASNTLVFYIRSKATWPATRSITVQWYNGATITGTPVVLRSGTFGFNSAITSGYTQIAMPNGLFGINGIPVTTVRFTVSGTGTNLGFYLDDITLQAGNAPVTLPTGIMIFRGAWSSTTQYNANDVVTAGNQLYVALQAGTGHAPASSSTFWTLTNPATVTSVSASGAAPLFTCSVANPTTAAAITCTISNAGPFTAYGNATSATAAPAFTLVGAPVSAANTAGTYTIAAADRTSLLTQNSAGASAWTLPQAGSAGFTGNYFVTVRNIGAGTTTITPTTSTINGASSIALTTNQYAQIYSDNTNYYALFGTVSAPAGFPRLDQVLDPNTSKTFNMGTNPLAFSYVGVGGEFSLQDDNGSTMFWNADNSGGLQIFTESFGSPLAVYGLGASADAQGTDTPSAVYGVHSIAGSSSSGTVPITAGLYVQSGYNTGGGSVTNNYGLFVANNDAATTGATNSWAIKTGLGLNEFGGAIQGDTLTASQCVGTNSSKQLVSNTNCATVGGVSSITGDGTIITNSGSTGAVTLTVDTHTGSGSIVLANTPTLITPVIGAATGTSLLATGIVDGTAPVTITTGTSATLGGTYNSGYTYNQEATAGTAVTYTLPTAAAGKQYCVGNSYNGSAADTGTLEIITSASGQYIIFTDGTLSATGGYVISGGAGRDSACVVGVDSTHWILYVYSGTWTKH